MPKGHPGMAVKLTAKQAAFVREYLVDLNATAAAARAGFKQPHVQGPRLLANVRVAAAIAELMAERSKRTEITADQVLKQWWQIATADPNELIEYRRVCCRHCHGQGHKFQFTPAESLQRERDWQVQAQKALAGGKEAPAPLDPEGGSGYDARKAPHPECPECFGEGVEKHFVKDTRRLSPAARLLYAGVKITREGLEIKMRDQDGALVNVATHLGMFKEVVEHKGDPDNPVKHEHSGAVEHGIDPAALRAFAADLAAAGLGNLPEDGGRQPVDPSPAASQAAAPP